MNPRLQIRLRNARVALIDFALALAIWLPCLHFFFRKPYRSAIGTRDLSY